MKRFVVIGSARSGTTVTHSLLRGHPEVSAFGEEVRIRELFGGGIELFTFASPKRAGVRESCLKNLFDVFALANASSETKAAGIKCAFGSLEAVKLFVNGITDVFPDMHIILVVRDDLVAQFGSAIRARKTGRYHSWNAPDQANGDVVRLPKGLFRHYVLETRESVDLIRTLGATHPLLEVSYERDISSGTQLHRKIFDFLGVSDIEPTWERTKKVSPPPHEFISNYGELRAIQDEVVRTGKAQFSARQSIHTIVKQTLYRMADWARMYP